MQRQKLGWTDEARGPPLPPSRLKAKLNGPEATAETATESQKMEEPESRPPTGCRAWDT